MATRTVKSEVTGKVLQLSAPVGAELDDGQDLMTIESMKMEIPVQAPCRGTLVEILVAEGAQVTMGQPLATISVQGT